MKKDKSRVYEGNLVNEKVTGKIRELADLMNLEFEEADIMREGVALYFRKKEVEHRHAVIPLYEEYQP